MNSWAPRILGRLAGVGLLCLASMPAPCAPPDKLAGQRIYQELCAKCHGPNGEGVPGKHDEPLYGNRSLESLTQRIARTMPEDAPEKCKGEEAAQVVPPQDDSQPGVTAH